MAEIQISKSGFQIGTRQYAIVSSVFNPSKYAPLRRAIAELRIEDGIGLLDIAPVWIGHDINTIRSYESRVR